MIGCISTKIDDHSYRVNTAPPNIGTTCNHNTTHNYAPEPVRCVQETIERKPNIYQQDKEYLQFIQEDSHKEDTTKTFSRREEGMYIEYNKNHIPTVVAKSWRIPPNPSTLAHMREQILNPSACIPSGNAGIPVYHVR